MSSELVSLGLNVIATRLQQEREWGGWTALTTMEPRPSAPGLRVLRAPGKWVQNLLEQQEPGFLLSIGLVFQWQLKGHGEQTYWTLGRR